MSAPLAPGTPVEVLVRHVWRRPPVIEIGSDGTFTVFVDRRCCGSKGYRLRLRLADEGVRWRRV